MIRSLGYIITDGKRYFADCNGTSITTDHMKAYVWKTQLAAENVLNNSCNKKFNSEDVYYIEEKTSYVTPINEDVKNTICDIMQFFDTYKIIRGANDGLTKRLSEVDRKISDVEHFIELTDQNAVNGYKLYKRLKDLRIERRNIKRLISLKEVFDTIKIDDNVEQNILGKVESFTNKCFSPREITLEDILGE